MSASPTRTASAPSWIRRITSSGTPHARFGDAQHVIRDRLTHPSECREVGGQRSQVAVVDADARRAGGDGHPRLIDVVDLHDRSRAAARHTRKAPVERFSVKHCHDQEHPVGTGDTRLGNLHRVEREILAQQGDVDDRANLGEVVERASEPWSVGEHRYGGDSTRGVIRSRARPDRSRAGAGRRSVSAASSRRSRCRRAAPPRCRARAASTRLLPRARPPRSEAVRPRRASLSAMAWSAPPAGLMRRPRRQRPRCRGSCEAARVLTGCPPTPGETARLRWERSDDAWP